MPVPLIRADADLADAAFEAYAALRRTESVRPELRENAHWAALRDTAFARFRAAFEVVQ
jgi:hypothetical protein